MNSRENIDRLLEKYPLLDPTTMAGFDLDFIRKFPRYVGSMELRVEQLKSAMNKNDYDLARATLHSMVGALWMMGAFALAEYTRELQGQAQKLEFSPLEPGWQETLEDLIAMTTLELEEEYLK